MSISKTTLVVATLGALTVWACAAAPNAQPELKPAPVAAAPSGRVASAEDLVNSTCSLCHKIDLVKNAKHTADEWPEVIDKMVQFGLEISDEDRKTIEAYLMAHNSTPPEAAR
jgi:cytochrome c5